MDKSKHLYKEMILLSKGEYQDLKQRQETTGNVNSVSGESIDGAVGSVMGGQVNNIELSGAGNF